MVQVHNDVVVHGVVVVSRAHLGQAGLVVRTRDALVPLMSLMFPRGRSGGGPVFLLAVLGSEARLACCGWSVCPATWRRGLSRSRAKME